MEPSPTATLSRTEARQIPGAFGDPFRAIEIMPGVTPIVSGLPFFFIRGTPPGDVGTRRVAGMLGPRSHAGAGRPLRPRASPAHAPRSRSGSDRDPHRRLRGGLQKAVQQSAGVELDIAEGMTGTLTAFHNGFFDKSDPLGVVESRDEPGLRNAFVKKKLTSRLGGLVSYTLSRSTRMYEARTFVAAFDRTHVANVALAYDLVKSWRGGGRVMLCASRSGGSSARRRGSPPSPSG